MRYIKKKRTFAMPEITMTPLVDTALTLLIIFIITAPMMRTTIKVDLPDSHTAQTTKVEEQSIVVEIDSQGLLHYEGKVFQIDGPQKSGVGDLSELKRLVADRVKKNRRQDTVFLYAYKTLRYKKIVEVFDVLNSTQGVQHVALVTQKIE